MSSNNYIYLYAETSSIKGTGKFKRLEIDFVDQKDNLQNVGSNTKCQCDNVGKQLNLFVHIYMNLTFLTWRLTE